MKQQASITKQTFTFPRDRWVQLGEPRDVQLWYRGFDTVVTASQIPWTADAWTRTTKRVGFKHQRARIDWYMTLRHLVVWKMGHFEHEITSIYGLPALVVFGTNTVCIDRAELNEWHETNRRLLGNQGTGLLEPRKKGHPRYRECDLLRRRWRQMSSDVQPSGSPSIGLM